MKIIFPYNEILPTKKAHDLYLFQEAYYLAQAGAEVTLLSGQGAYAKEALFHHYGVGKDSLVLSFLPILRKNNPLGISWNLPFFFYTQKFLTQSSPQVVVLSVFKQGEYHLQRKLPSILYVYEVHELKYYPHQKMDRRLVDKEKRMLAQADVIIVTTHALASILTKPPYNLTNPIYCIPLASNVEQLPVSTAKKKSLFAYIGQLYQGQGIELLLQALALTQHINCKIIGGKPAEIAHYKKIAAQLSVQERVEFAGFCPPHELPTLLKEVDGFVAPFEATGKMPYVAHVKLIEYLRFGKPIIAPHLEVVKEHFPENKGICFFEAGNPQSLASALEYIELDKLQKEILPLSSKFSWKERAENYLSILSHHLR